MMKLHRQLRASIGKEGFFQVVLVLPSGQSMEVGGSLDPTHGLSSVFRDPDVGDYRVTKDPPSSVREMIKILVSFNRGDKRWQFMFDYEAIPYDT